MKTLEGFVPRRNDPLYVLVDKRGRTHAWNTERALCMECRAMVPDHEHQFADWVDRPGMTRLSHCSVHRVSA